MGIGFTGIDAAIAKLQRNKLLVRGQLTDTKKRLVRHVLTDLIMNSPQWSGNLVAQWHLELHGSRGAYRQIAEYVPPEQFRGRSDPNQMGDLPAHVVLQEQLALISLIRWNSKIRITNYAPYASEVEDNIGPASNDATQDGDHKGIRLENRLASYGRVAMIGYVEMKYSNLRKLRTLAE